jgi:hypothetical protein
MRCCLGVLLLIAGIAAGLFLVVLDPALPDQASRVVTWANGEIHPPTPPTPDTAPVTIITANPTAARVALTPAWTIFDCAFAVDVLTEDSHLDAEAFQEGLSPASDPYYYATISAQWKVDAGYATEQCGKPAGVLTGSELTAPPAQFALAITSHQGDEILHSANTAWDTLWISQYQRLEALWTLAVGPA